VASTEARSLDDVPVMGEEEKYALAQRMAAMDKLLEVQKVAKYKLEIFFTQGRSLRRPYPGAISVWSSGTMLHGGGDTNVHFCPGKKLKFNDCTGFIPNHAQGYGFLVCPTCQHVWQEHEVDDLVQYNLTTQNWAIAILKFFTRLGHNADLYLKHPLHDLRKASDLEQKKQWMGEKLSVVRTQRVKVNYTLARIIQDTSAGKDLLSCIYGFLTA
jgi:hypothetical protein